MNNSLIFIIIDVLDSPFNSLQNKGLIIKIGYFFPKLLAIKDDGYFHKKFPNLEKFLNWLYELEFGLYELEIENMYLYLFYYIINII